MIKGILRNLFLGFTKKVYKLLVFVLPLKKGTTAENRDEEIIISLTSYPKRFDYLYLCLKSLLYQTVKPNRIILWLGDDSSLSDLPFRVLLMKKYGVEIEFVNENIKSHKKYYYAMQNYTNSIVITLDDDVIYSPFLVESLLECHKHYPNAVCARRVHAMTFDNGKLMKYSEWKHAISGPEKIGMHLFAVGVGGILYPPHCLNTEVFNKEKFKEICFNADDVWLKFMEVLNGTKVAKAKSIWTHPINIDENDDSGLKLTNVNKNQNDIYLENMLKEYPSFMKILDTSNEL